MSESKECAVCGQEPVGVFRLCAAHGRYGGVALDLIDMERLAEELTVGLTITSWPADGTAYEKGWNEALAAVRKRAREGMR